MADAWNLLGALYHHHARMNEAEGCYRRAVALRPSYAEAHGNLGVCLQAQSRWEEAEAAYRAAIDANTGFYDAYANLASLLHFLGRVDEAEAACRRALQLRPNFANAYVNLGAALHSQGRVEEAHQSYWAASKSNPPSAVMHSYALFAEQYLPDVTPQRLREVHDESGPAAGRAAPPDLAAARQHPRSRAAPAAGLRFPRPEQTSGGHVAAAGDREPGPGELSGHAV